MISWFPPNLVECLGWTLVHFLWQGFVIAALLAAGLRLLRHAAPDHRYLAGCLALLLLVAAPLVTLHQVAGRYPAKPSANLGSIPAPASVETTSRDTDPQTKLVTATRVAKNNPGLLQRLENFFPSLVLGWSLGVLALSCRLLGGWLEVRRLKRTATAALDGIWPAKLAALSHRLGLRRPVRLLQSALVEVPTVLGWLRPVILLPASCLAGLTPAQLEAILAHELAHIRRHDYLVNLLQSVVETVLFYHPAVWWISRRVREEREHCCDDLAIEICGDRIAYARALATLEELRLAPAQFALAAAGAPLLPRIRRLAGKSAHTPNRPAWPLAGLIVLFLLALLALGLRSHRALARDRAADPVNPPPAHQSATKSETLLPPPKLTSLNYDRLPPSESTNPVQPLFTRTYHLDPTAFHEALKDFEAAPPSDALPNNLNDRAGDGGGVQRNTTSVPGVTFTTNAPAEAVRVRQFLMAAGMDLDPTKPANLGKAVFWNDNKGLLMLHGTRQELEDVQTDLAKLNLPPPADENKPGPIPVQASTAAKALRPKVAVPQFNVQVKFVEMDAEPDGSSFIGVLDNSLPVQSSTGQSPDSSLVPKLASSPKVFSDPKRPVTNSIIQQMTGILTGEQARQVIAALERRDGVDVLTAPQVTTESGRQARMQIGEMQTVVTGLTPASGPNGTNLYTTEIIPLGPVVDVIPRVSPDGKIELVVVATVTEFLGYDKPNRAQAAAFPGATVPLPRFRLRTMSTGASVQDGGTLVLGGVEDERVVEVQDKVPLLGDLPLAGRLFRTTIKNKSRKNLLIFITPRLINPDGTPVHPDPISGPGPLAPPRSK